MVWRRFDGLGSAFVQHIRARPDDQRSGGKTLVDSSVHNTTTQRHLLTWDPPRSDDLDVGFQPIECEFEPNLIVAFPGAPVGHETGGVGDIKPQIETK
jgi:hypothetical protein